MDYIVGGAYKSLLFALYLKNILGEKITIITYKKDVIRFCEAENIDYIKIKRVKFTASTLYEVFTLKKTLDDLIEEIEIKKEDKIFLLSNAKGYDFFYLAKELSNKCIGYYKNPDKELKIFKPPRFKPIFIRGAVIKSVLKLVLDLDLIYYRGNNENPYLGIGEKYLDRNNIIRYASDISSEDIILEVVKKSKLNFKEFDNLIIDQGPLINRVRFDTMRMLYKNLLDLPIDFSFKRHPRSTTQEPQLDLNSNDYYELFKNCDELPRYIPVELFCSNVKKNVIALFSTSLIPISQLKHLKAISLLELVEWVNTSWKNEVKDHLIKKSNNKILFPKSFEELREIIIK